MSEIHAERLLVGSIVIALLLAFGGLALLFIAKPVASLIAVGMLITTIALGYVIGWILV